MQRDLFEGFLDEEWNVEEVDGSMSRPGTIDRLTDLGVTYKLYN